MRETAALAERFDCPLHTHLAETEDETRFCQERYGCRPVEFLERTGWLVPRAWLAHGIHFDEREIATLGRHGLGVCHCAASNMVLASGICRTVELEAAGAKVGLGVDGSASNDASNMMEALRQALMIGRLRYGADAITHRDVLRWGTEGSARCIGRDDIGRIAPGYQADLALFTLDETRFAGAHDPLAALILCSAHRADRVMVGGTLARGGRSAFGHRPCQIDRRSAPSREAICVSQAGRKPPFRPRSSGHARFEEPLV